MLVSRRLARWFAPSLLAVLLFSVGTLAAADAPPLVLLDVAAADAAARLQPTTPQVTVAPSADAAAPGLVLTIVPGKEGYPGVRLAPAAGAAWDLSAYGHVEARVTNLGTTTASLALRVDNAGPWQDGPWNTESVYLKPGASGTVTVIFGYQYGKKKGYALKPGAVISLLFFTTKSPAEQKLRIEAVTAAGPAGETPPVQPGDVRVPPTADGILFGTGVAADAVKLSGAKNAVAALAPEAATPTLKATLPAGSAEAAVTVQPNVGRWDLRRTSEVRVTLTNTGAAAVTPRVRVDSNGGPTDVITGALLAPGASGEVVVPFIPATPWTAIPNSGDRTSWNGVTGTGTKFTSDAVSGVTVSALPADAERSLQVTRVAALATPAAMPDWLGQRPPVEGEWTKTFTEEFDGTTLDASKWNNVGPNYWDKQSHWSKDNVIVGGGVVRLHYEKKTGNNNDNEKEKETAYQSGYLDTYGKFTQRYGYFEARMKLPTAPGLWPAFWMMPDRGVDAGPQWKRQDTGHGGMEIDIMEHLTRWGQFRYNIAMHWDGYDKAHKQTGTSNLYVAADKDGYITCGLLWLPGCLVYYANGKELARWDDPRVSQIPADMMFTLPMGGWDNDSLDDAKLPADFVIDYVRVWQRPDLAALPAYVPEPKAPAPAAELPKDAIVPDAK